MIRRAVVIASFFSLSLAFSGTSPFVAWSAHSAATLDSLAARLPEPARFTHVLDSILNHKQICSFDAVVVFEQPGLHASDLRALPASSGLKLLVDDAPSSFQLPYARHSSPVSLSEFTSSIASKCGFKHTPYVLTEGKPFVDSSAKHVLHLSLPYTEVTGSRKSSISHYESMISGHIDGLSTSHPNHLVIITGIPGHIHKRQSSTSVGNAFDQKNSVAPNGGILKRYQLLTPGLITTLLVTFFVIVPVIMVGINALSSIKSPLRAEVPKSFNAQERKNQ